MPKRKITKTLIFECILGGIFSAFLGYLLSAGMGPGVTLFPWLTYQREVVFSDVPASFFANYYNAYTIKTVFLAVGAYLIILLILRLNQHNLMLNKTFGSAVWGNVKEINARLKDKGVDSKENKRGEDTFYYVKDGVLYWGKEKKAGKEEVHG